MMVQLKYLIVFGLTEIFIQDLIASLIMNTLKMLNGQEKKILKYMKTNTVI